MSTFSTTTTLSTAECCNCGVAFAMPTELKKKLLQTQDSFYCPNGHKQYYVGKARVERLENALADAKDTIRSVRSYSDSLEERLARKDRQNAALKGHLTRLRRKLAGRNDA